MKAMWEMPRVDLEAFEATNAIAACDSTTGYTFELDCLYGNQVESRGKLVSSAYDKEYSVTSGCTVNCGFTTYEEAQYIQTSDYKNNYTKNEENTIKYTSSQGTLKIEPLSNILGWLYVNFSNNGSENCTHGWTDKGNYLEFAANCDDVDQMWHVEYAAVTGQFAIGS